MTSEPEDTLPPDDPTELHTRKFQRELSAGLIESTSAAIACAAQVAHTTTVTTATSQIRRERPTIIV